MQKNKWILENLLFSIIKFSFSSTYPGLNSNFPDLSRLAEDSPDIIKEFRILRRLKELECFIHKLYL